MTDDIVTRLRQKYAGQLPICTEAADEIERLRGICDMLANRLRSGSDSGWDDAIDEWEDVSEFGNDPESQGSAKLSPNSETNVDDTIPNDSVKEYAEYLYDLAFNAHLTQADHETLKHAARLLLKLQRSIGIKDGMLKSWDFMLNEAREQAQEAHAIVGSDAMVWLMRWTDRNESVLDVIRERITRYWDKYGTLGQPRHQIQAKPDVKDLAEKLRQLTMNISHWLSEESIQLLVTAASELEKLRGKSTNGK